jgi:hypothetical protein
LPSESQDNLPNLTYEFEIDNPSWVTLDVLSRCDRVSGMVFRWKQPTRHTKFDYQVFFPVSPSKQFVRHRIPLGLFNGGEVLTFLPIDRSGTAEISEMSILFTPLLQK